MHTLIGCVLLLSLASFCAVCLRRFAGETDACLLTLASVGLGGVLLILGEALLLPWLSPATSLLLLTVLALGTTAALARGQSWEPMVGRPDALWLNLAAIPGVLLTGYFALFIMSVSFGVDDGFFVHTSNMGMIMAGKYPPTSFLGEPWQGHYGKDMLTALLALGFGENFLEMEWISTCAIQVLHFLFLVHWLRVEGGSPAFGLLGGYMAFFASAFGSHLGLVDTIANNNAVAYWTLTLCSYLLLRWWRDPDNRQLAVMAGIFLGADALIYELHFGLLGLALFTFVVGFPKRYKGFLLLVTVAVVLASVEGGAITHIARKAILGRAAHQQNTKKAWQSQDVALKFPKDQPFVLRRDNLRPSRFFETKLRPTGADFLPSRDSVPLWSGSILACFWYPVWLAPLTLLLLLRTRNWLAGWFFCLGTFSVLTPCLVSFGYFEGETARWLFGASVGLSTAFALVLAQALGRPKPWRYGAWAVLLWTVWFNLPVIPMEVQEMRLALSQPGNSLRDGSPGIVPSGGLRPNPRLSLAHHYGFDDSDWFMTEELRKLGESNPDFLGVRYLANYPDEATAQGVEVASGGMLNIIGLQTGLSGRLPAGISGAPENRWCPPLFSQKLQARAFWADPQNWRLDAMLVNWLLIDESRLTPEQLTRIEALNGLERVTQREGLSLWQRSQTGTASALQANSFMSIEKAESPTLPIGPRQPFQLRYSYQATNNGLARLEFRYLAPDGGEPANPDDLLSEQTTVAKGSGHAQTQLVAPYFAGHYQLQWRSVGETDWKPLIELNVEEPEILSVPPSSEGRTIP